MKKGFTLIELLGVIVILSVIALITTPIIQSAISNNKNATCESQTKSYEKAAKNYVTNNIYEYDCNPGENEAEFEVNLSDLIENGYIDENIDNPKGGTFTGYVKLTLNCQNKNYKYSFEYIPSNGEIRCRD